MNEDEDLSTEVQDLLSKGRKIDAIKRLREEKNLGLKDAKTLVDDYVSRHPERFPEQQTTSSGGRFLIIALLLIAVALTYQQFFMD